jgi:hypothetical protein
VIGAGEGGGVLSLQQCSRAIDLLPAGSLPAAEPQLLPPSPPPESHKLIISRTPRIIKMLLFTPRTFTVVTLLRFPPKRSNIRRSVHNLLCTTNTDVSSHRVAFFVLLKIPTVILRYEPMGTGGSLPRVKRPGGEADHSPPTTAKVKNTWSSTSTPLTSSWRNA